jgi:predicted DCC family thiol-disulfide oxidoreductase YuxK
MNATRLYPAWQFAFFRIVFGLYLFVHFAQLIPWAGELFSRTGMLGDARLNFTHGILPNPLERWDTPAFATGFLAMLTLLAGLFTLGIARRTTALLLWFGWACLFNRNNLILNPGLPYVGLLLVLCALVPPGEPWSFRRRPADPDWKLPAMIYWVAWWLLMLGYTASGLWKLDSPSWLDGSALHHLLTNPLARPNFLRSLLLELPSPCLQVLTWLALAGEILTLPLALFRRTRWLAWTWMLAMHLGLLCVVNFADLTLGLVMIHLFTFDLGWLPKAVAGPAGEDYSRRRMLVLFDGQCALCHGWVKFLLARDRRGTFRFAPQQGTTAAPYFARHGLTDVALRSVVVVLDADGPNERLLLKSDAALEALAALGGLWRALLAFRWVPRVVRDWVYDFIAKRRYRWFGTTDACLLPPPGSMSRMLP